MELTNETKAWLVERNVAPIFFPMLENAGLVNIDLLESISLCHMKKKMDVHFATHLFFKPQPTKKLTKSIKFFLRSRDIDKEYDRFIERLCVKSVIQLKFITLYHLTGIGMSEFRAECLVQILQKKFPKSTPHVSFKEISGDVFPLSSSDSSSESESEDEKGATHHSLVIGQKTKRRRSLKKIIDDGSARATPIKRKGRKRRKKSLNQSSYQWHAFKNAKKLHLGDFAKDLFYKYHDMFELKRKRSGTGKWLYKVNTGEEFQVVGALFPAMQLCSVVERKRAIGAPIEHLVKK